MGLPCSFACAAPADRKRSSTRNTVSGFAYSTYISTCPKSKTANLLSKVKLHLDDVQKAAGRLNIDLPTIFTTVVNQ
jgi:hypothetical protein